MPKFLDTKGLTIAIKSIIDEAKEELVIIVPFIQASELVVSSLEEADSRDVDITIVCRKKQISCEELVKLEKITNLNLLDHPHLHAKAYLNENNIIIGSMNMYEYSEKNNREIGVLFDVYDDDDVFVDAVAELRSIIVSSDIVKRSAKTKKLGLRVNILRTQMEVIQDECLLVNRIFVNKTFVPQKYGKEYVPVCIGYSEHINIFLDNKVTLKFNFQGIEEVYSLFKPQIEEYLINGFKFYWNSYKQPAFLYRDRKADIWKSYDETDYYENIKIAIENLVGRLKPVIYEVINK